MVVISGCSICQWEGFQSCTLEIWINKIVDREISVDRTHICIHLLHQLITDVDIWYWLLTVLSWWAVLSWDLGTLGWLDPAYPSEDWLEMFGDVRGTQRAGKNGTMQIIYDSPLSLSSTVMIINCMRNHMVLWCAISDSHSGAVITVSIYDYPLGDPSSWLSPNSPTWLQVKTFLSLRRVMAMMLWNNASILVNNDVQGAGYMTINTFPFEGTMCHSFWDIRCFPLSASRNHMGGGFPKHLPQNHPLHGSLVAKKIVLGVPQVKLRVSPGSW